MKAEVLTNSEEAQKDQKPAALPPASDQFLHRHLGPRPEEIKKMLGTLGVPSLEALADEVVPRDIRFKGALKLPKPLGEQEALQKLRAIASKNQAFRSYIGMGYHDTYTPAVILRNVIENPGWYTAYTPYQAEIAQGRLEALLNFQTMIADLTGLAVANASLLDEPTAAAEAMALARAARAHETADVFLVSEACHPQTIEVVRTRAAAAGVAVEVSRESSFRLEKGRVFGVLLQYPATDGTVRDTRALIGKAHEAGALVAMAADPLALTLLTPPGELGADIAVGSTQRFGVPLGFGGPHAAYFATRDALKRQMPGRIVGISKDAAGRPALRLALQTREQHIRRDRATSNICTAQVLLAVAASMYAVYHGPEGLTAIARRVRRFASALAEGLLRLGFDPGSEPFFDTVTVHPGASGLAVLAAAKARRVNLRALGDGRLSIALDETVSEEDLRVLLEIFAGGKVLPRLEELLAVEPPALPQALARKSSFLTHLVFNSHRSETEMMRYLHELEAKDLALNSSMIALGSCTMKLNAAAEMMPVTWPEFGRLHPYAPVEQAAGYRELFSQLEAWLAEITGFAAVSLQPNAGSQGEFSGLLAIRRYHERRGEGARKVCLIPHSAHGTNPASAVMAGLKVVEVACDPQGNVDVGDLRLKADEHAKDLACLMITYPSTHGVFEERIREICDIVHGHGGQVYMDGANMNAQVGLCRPGDYGADVCHLNLHKTFAIPHGGGGPGVGPIAVARHLAAFLPRHPLAGKDTDGVGAVSGAPWGSPSVLVIPWMYIAMMGAEGLREASLVAILNANYVARRLDEHYPVLYKGKKGFVAHECIVDLRQFKSADVQVEDVAKRLMDFGFHAPTVSFPVPGTMMVEPTESEDLGELDRFCEAMTTIRGEIRDVAEGRLDRADNPLKNAPHTAEAVAADKWEHRYSRERAAFPAAWLRGRKYWPPVGRIDNPYGDRNFLCTCQ